MIGKTYGNYRIEQQIGEGGMGVLYLATDLSTRRQVAMKFIRPYLASDPQFQQRFIQEARAIVALDHPNIIRVLHFSSGQGPLFIVMEYINGGSLRDYQKWLFRQQRAIEINDAIRITQQIADALHYAHRVNMVHRDVKPDNVLLRLGSNNTIQQAVLTDFGLAGLAATVSTTGAPKGTFAYMSPEQCQGERVDGRSDIYSLGIMLYELVVGRLPFQPANLNDAIRMHASAPVPPPSQFRPNIPQVLEQIILKALAKSPNERFQNASAMAQALLGASSPGAQAQPAQPAAPVGVRTEYGSPPAIAPAPQMDNPPVAPGDAGKLRLVYGRSGQAANFAWLDRDVLMIGREQGNNIMLEGAQISRNHARIDRGNDGRVRITDLGSSNGTYLGNMRLNPNTPYEWRPGQMARIGEFWVKLETAVATQPPPGQPAQAGQAAMGAPGLVLPAAGPQPLNSAVYSVVPPAAAASNTPQATTARINAKLLSDIISVQAGGRTIITVEVFNQGSVVDHFSAEVRGLPQDWYTLPPEAVQLLPSQRNNLLISLHPPRHSRSTAGVHPYDILIRSRNAPNEYVTRPGKLQIEPFYGLETAVYPKRLRQLGAFDVSVTNSGNTQENYSVNASDPEQSLEMVVDRPQVQVPPGQTEKVLVRVRPRMRPLVGTSKTIPVSMAIKSLRAEGEQQSQTAEFVNGPLLPTWLISGASLLFTLCIMLGIFGVIAKRASDLASLETGNTSATQAVIASQTALAAADDDLDGLTNQKEGQLGTDPQNSDTRWRWGWAMATR
ncbi:MAG: protein kinase [Anaerolineae bacterium]